MGKRLPDCVFWPDPVTGWVRWKSPERMGLMLVHSEKVPRSAQPPPPTAVLVAGRLLDSGVGHRKTQKSNEEKGVCDLNKEALDSFDA